MKEFKFSDELISNLVQLTQLAILTGTNILDHLRLMKVGDANEDGKLVLTEQYKETYSKYIADLLEKANQVQNEQTEIKDEFLDQ